MAERNKKSQRESGSRTSPTVLAKSLKTKGLSKGRGPQTPAPEPEDPRLVAQRKLYEEAALLFQQQKFQRSQQVFEKVLVGPSTEIADRARVHLRMCEQRISKMAAPSPKTADEHYHHGIAMMNLCRWDEARESLEKARKMSPKADYVHYAMAALDCLVGESDSALKNLKTAIALRPENRYHARNDEDFTSLFEDPRFTELLYPERDSSVL